MKQIYFCLGQYKCIKYGRKVIITCIKCNKQRVRRWASSRLFPLHMSNQTSSGSLTRRESLTHHLNLNYSLCLWVSLSPLNFDQGRCSCWLRGVKAAKPLLAGRKWKLVCCCWSHGSLERWMVQKAPAGLGSELVGVCIQVNVCFEAKRSELVKRPLCPQASRAWLENAHQVPALPVAFIQFRRSKIDQDIPGVVNINTSPTHYVHIVLFLAQFAVFAF